jgi:hypothetical protein
MILWRLLENDNFNVGALVFFHFLFHLLLLPANPDLALSHGLTFFGARALR